MNKTKCNICDGFGIIKNNLLFEECNNCKGIKCEHTPNDYIYLQFKECLNCYNNQKNSDENDSCKSCHGTGFIKNYPLECDKCENKHKHCGCRKIINPYKECYKCFGSGEIIE